MKQRIESIDESISTFAKKLSKALAETAATARKEEEIRIAVERELGLIEEQLGIRLAGKHEFTVASGRVDSVYSGVVIEYKHPNSAARIGTNLRAAGTRAVVEQIQSRLDDLKNDFGHPITSLLGVGTDGRRFVFVKFRNGEWEAQEPVDVTPSSVERFLWALFNLGKSGKAFTPDNLSEDFGASGPLAKEGVRTLYKAIIKTTNQKSRIFFDEWRILFGEVCGYDVDRPNDRIYALAEAYGIDPDTIQTAELLFALHTYYALLMKLLASDVIAFFHKLPSPRQKMLAATTSAKLQREVADLEDGGIFRHLNITNFLEGDLFSWYSFQWTPDVERLIRDMVQRLDGYNPGTLSEEPDASRDLLKKLYHQLFPRSVRHDMGEYYTPDWLADHVLDRVQYDGNPVARLLDPACGSGTFLVRAINRARSHFAEHRERTGLTEGQFCNLLLQNVVGFDLNPLAVMAARTNYLIAIRDLISHVDRIEIPIYLCDSILTPLEYGDLFSGKLGDIRELPTAVGRFLIPNEITLNHETVSRYTEQIEFCVKQAYEPQEFLERLREENLPCLSEKVHIDLFTMLRELDKAKKNGVWARIIKNAFAPIFVGTVDFVVGNPPWVNWENLPREYRESTANLWQTYELFQQKGLKARLGGGKDDISILMTYTAHDRYLREGGTLGFVITQSLFKTKGGGEGFRRFRYATSKEIRYLAPVEVDDLSAFQPFEGATNKTSVFVCGKGSKPLSYPVRYVRWNRKKGMSIGQDLPLKEVLKRTARVELAAVPVDENVPTSPWLTGTLETIRIMRKLKGISGYKPRKGVYCPTNAIYWLTDVKRISKVSVLISNLADTGKKVVRRVTQAVEDEFVFPLVRGKDVNRWSWSSELSILLPQDPDEPAKAMAEDVLKKTFPKTYAYFKQFEREIRKCALLAQFFNPKVDPFYSSYNVGSYTFKKYKVVWKEICKEIEAVVIANSVRPSVPDHKLVIVGFDEQLAAYYLCGVLNSSPIRLLVRAYASYTSISAHITEYVNIPLFDKSNERHQEIANIARECHEVARKNPTDLQRLETKLDKLVAALWGIKQAELSHIREAIATSVAGGEEVEREVEAT